MPTSSASVLIAPRVGGVTADLGHPELPRSKSHGQRALLLAALGRGSTLIRNVPAAQDVAVLVAALRAVGARLEARDEGLLVEAAVSLTPGATIDCGENGTALRMLVVALGLLGARARFTASARLRARPLGGARTLLAGAGARLSDVWPLQLEGEVALPARLTADASVTTQPASGALLTIAGRLERGLPPVALEVVHAQAGGFLDVTIDVLGAFGFRVHQQVVASGRMFEVALGAQRAGEYDVPVDASSVAFPAALAALHGLDHRALAPGRGRDRHPDWGVIDDLERLCGAAAEAEVTVDDLGARPDTFPALCAVAACRSGTTVLRGAPALRGKESDRIAAMAAGLRAIGVRCEELRDGLVLHGRDAFAAGEPLLLPAPPDHRVVMALALLGTRRPGGVLLPHADAVAKSWPGFFAWLARVADVKPA